MIRMAWNDRLYKLLLIGDSNVGKSGIQQKYVDDIFLSTFNPTIGMSVKCAIHICTCIVYTYVYWLNTSYKG